MAKTDETPTRRARGRPRDWHDKTAQNTIKSLDRAMQILERLSELNGATLTDLAGDLGESTATTYRVLVTLEARGIVDFDQNAQIWHVGAGAFLIGSRFLRRTSLVERARPVLRALMEATGETANLGVEREGFVLFVSQVETHASIRAFFPPGTLSPMHSSGIGKALLSGMESARAARVIGARSLEAFTPMTLANPADLVADLGRAKARGYAVDDEERTEGMRCIAAPIFDLHGEPVAGISVSGPTTRVKPEAVESIAKHVVAAAAELTAAMGGKA